MLEIRYDKEKVKAVERALREVPRQMPMVMSRALNRTASKARTDITRSLAATTGLKQKFIRPRIVLQKASRYRWHSADIVSSKRIPLMAFGPRQAAPGVTIRDVMQGKGRILIRHAFIAVMPSGHKGVFKRETKKRLPIKEQYGPSLGQVFTDAKIEAGRIAAASAALLAKNIDDQVNLILSRRMPA